MILHLVLPVASKKNLRAQAEAPPSKGAEPVFQPRHMGLETGSLAISCWVLHGKRLSMIVLMGSSGPATASCKSIDWKNLPSWNTGIPASTYLFMGRSQKIFKIDHCWVASKTDTANPLLPEVPSPVPPLRFPACLGLHQGRHALQP